MLLLDLLNVSSLFPLTETHLVSLMWFIKCHILSSICALCLSLSQSSPRCVHSIILGTLLELCDNTNTVSHILSWRDGDGQTAPGLLLQLWREEEVELGISRSKNGEITGQSAAKSVRDCTRLLEIFSAFTCIMIYCFGSYIFTEHQVSIHHQIK